MATRLRGARRPTVHGHRLMRGAASALLLAAIMRAPAAAQDTPAAAPETEVNTQEYPSSSQENPAEPARFALEPIVVTATRQPQSIMQAPASISVVDKAEIQD